MGLRRRGEHPSNQHDDVVAEAEAILSGQTALRFLAQGWRVPVWAWINALAHADGFDLLRLTSVGSSATPGSPEATIGRLAARLRQEGARTGDLRAVQTSVLVPLELELLRRSSSRLLGVAQLEALVDSLLEDYHTGYPSGGE